MLSTRTATAERVKENPKQRSITDPVGGNRIEEKRHTAVFDSISGLVC